MSDGKKIMKTLNGYTVYDEDAHRRIDSLAGSALGLVFDTVVDMEAYVAEHHAELKVGQNLYIREVDVPDYWWDGTAVQELEVKVDLSGYAKQEEVDRLSEAIADRATLGNGVITFWKGDTELFTVDISSVGGSGGGVSFVLGETLELDNGVLNVKTTNAAERDNTLPITSSGVYTIVGNIGAVLDTI